VLTVEENYYTLKEIAERLKVNYRTVYRWVHAGKLPGYKFGSDWRVKGSDLDAFIESRRSDKEGR
jgi:excisionase family DNA binding protein